MQRIHVASLVIVSVLSSPALACAQESHTVAPTESSAAAPSFLQRGGLISLSAGVASLQAYDTYSTLTALTHGAAEANPLMQGIVQHPAALIVLKGAVTVGSVYAATQLWRQHHRGAALVLLAATSGASAAVAAHNASVVRAVRESGR